MLILLILIIIVATKGHKLCHSKENEYCLPDFVTVGCKCDPSTTKIVNRDGSFACITGIFVCNSSCIEFCCEQGFHIDLDTMQCEPHRNCTIPSPLADCSVPN